MLISILIAIIFLLSFWIRKQKQYIADIKKISEQKSQELDLAEACIIALTDEQFSDKE